MSRFTDSLGSLKAAASKLRSVEIARLQGVPGTGAVTIWIDGERARVLAPSGAHGASVALATPGDVQAASKAFEQLAPKPARPGLHMLRVLVGAPFVRYFALPWQPLPKPQDWISAARMQFVQAGVQGVEQWRFTIADGPWGEGRLAAAVPEALCAGVAHVCKARRLMLLGMEPAFTFALSKHARRMRDGAIAVAELEETSARAAIAHIGLRHGGQWTAFIALPVPDRIDDVLRDALALWDAPPPERLYVIGPGGAQRWVEDAAHIEWLPAPWDAAA